MVLISVDLPSPVCPVSVQSNCYYRGIAKMLTDANDIELEATF